MGSDRLKLMPTLGIITFIGEERSSANGYTYRQIGIALDTEKLIATVFSGTSSYIGSYAKSGSKLFLEDWSINKKVIDNIEKYDIIISKAKIA